MLHTYHIHVSGLVQGVGFRPFVCRLAEEMNINGWVCNSNDGLHIRCNTSAETATLFYTTITQHPPENAIITDHLIQEISTEIFSSFYIKESQSDIVPNLLLTPDIALCNNCYQDINNTNNKRYRYPFTTCLNCGPRYSITQLLPYDRINTTMVNLPMCSSCISEYTDIHNRRHFSQTNSCKTCTIPLHFYTSKQKEEPFSDIELIENIVTRLNQGEIACVKGVGGYLLLCDATNESAILLLRERKQRPAKPFAILYADIEMASADVQLRSFEIDALKSKIAPIVLCKAKPFLGNGICKNYIAPDLDKIGVMLPYTALLSILANDFGKPLIATSANISGSPILYKDEDALNYMFDVADFIVTYDRDIVAPQDDSVIQFTDRGQKIIIRRSRGLAPNYFPNPFSKLNESVLATGGELKSAFAFLTNKNLYISQYLGDQGTIDAQTCFTHTLSHFNTLLQKQPTKLISDKHPDYFVTHLAKETAVKNKITPPLEVQHHKAHFGAVLAENKLLSLQEPILGFVWDGTGYGDDGQIWGSEVFIFQNHEMNRVAHLKYFPQLLGDKMSKEPRLAALSLLNNFPTKYFSIQKYFSKTEWQYYQKLLLQKTPLQTCSMGRFLDGLACILGIRIYNTYEGEAAMQMEALARSCSYKPYDYYSLPLHNGELDWRVFMQEFLEDWQQKEDISLMAWKVFYSLAKSIAQLSSHFFIDKITFSGGVFQNALLTDLIIEQLSHKRHLFFHQQLSPNDENIGFGQLAYYQIKQSIINNSTPESKNYLSVLS